jgi:3-methyladenine DNA glycosylase AlkC
MAELLTEVDRFKKWADAYPPGPRSGEWECDYPDWEPLYAAVLELLDCRPVAAWSAEETQAVLYALARDNEIQYLAREIRRRHPATLIRLAQEATRTGEPDAKWQLAEELGRLQSDGSQAEQILLQLVRDEDEYVRRRALQALARLGSSAVEELALRAWQRPHEHQQWMRMAVLWSLHRIGSPLLAGLLEDAEKDSRAYLRDFAGRVRQGQVEP